MNQKIIVGVVLGVGLFMAGLWIGQSAWAPATDNSVALPEQRNSLPMPPDGTTPPEPADLPVTSGTPAGQVALPSSEPGDPFPDSIETQQLADDFSSEVIAAQIRPQVEAANGFSPGSIEIKVSRIEDTYAMGGVLPVPRDVGGGVWFGAYVNGQWQLVADGQGSIDCSELAPYPDFPSSMIEVCMGDQGPVQR